MPSLAETSATTSPAPAPSSPFAVGDSVRLKGGGPVLTVRSVNPSGEYVTAFWFDGTLQLKHEQFPFGTLVGAEAKK